MKVSCNYPVDWTHLKLVGRPHQIVPWFLKQTTFFLTCGNVLHYRIRYDVFSEKFVYTFYLMCFTDMVASVFKSLTFLYWISELSLTWNFEVLEKFIYYRLQCFHQSEGVRVKISQWEDGKSWMVGIWQQIILTIWAFFKAKNNILEIMSIY